MDGNINSKQIENGILKYVTPEVLANCFTLKEPNNNLEVTDLSQPTLESRWKNTIKKELKIPPRDANGKIAIDMCTGCIILGSLFFSSIEDLINNGEISPNIVTKKDKEKMVSIMDSISSQLKNETGYSVPNFWISAGMSVIGSYSKYGDIIYKCGDTVFPHGDKNPEDLIDENHKPEYERLIDIYIKRGRKEYLELKDQGYRSSIPYEYQNQTVADSAIIKRLSKFLEGQQKRKQPQTKNDEFER